MLNNLFSIHCCCVSDCFCQQLQTPTTHTHDSESLRCKHLHHKIYTILHNVNVVRVNIILTAEDKMIITFCVRRSRSEMYTGHGRLCICLSLTTFRHCCMDLDVSCGNGRGYPVVVHYWADLQLVQSFHCYDNID